VRVCFKKDYPHSIADFTRGRIPEIEQANMHCWYTIKQLPFGNDNIPNRENTTFREVCYWIAEQFPTVSVLASLKLLIFLQARDRNIKMTCRVVFIDQQGNYTAKDVATILNFKYTFDDRKTLKDAKFNIGDFLDVSVEIPGSEYEPRSRESTAVRPIDRNRHWSRKTEEVDTRKWSREDTRRSERYQPRKESDSRREYNSYQPKRRRFE
jgi:hypothetical protein